MKTSGAKILEEVAQHPPRDDGIVAEDQPGPDHRDVAVDAQRVSRPGIGEGLDDIALRATSQREFCQKQRQPDQNECAAIGDQKRAAAILAGDVGEPPDIAEADRASQRGEDEAGACRPLLAGPRFRSARHRR